MSDSIESQPPGPNVAVMKGIALGLGVLLIAGTLLLITLVLKRDTPVADITLPTLELQEGEKVTSASLFDQQALFIIENEAGEQRMVLVNLVSGTRDNVPIVRP
ncbi:MAG: hypothetical protein AAF830_02825 [Pseudomonadota bacterium]